MSLEFLREQGVDCIICTGDIADGKGDVNACCDLLREHGVLTVRGNHDRWLLGDRVRHIDDATRLSELSAASKRYLDQLPAGLSVQTLMGPLLLCHGMLGADQRKIWPGTQRMPPERCERLDALIAEDGYRLIINGHMHYRCLVHFERLTLVNAGTLKQRHKPGFSIVDTQDEQVTAFEFDAAAPVEVCRRSLRATAADRVWRNTQHFDGRWQPNVLYATDPAT